MNIALLHPDQFISESCAKATEAQTIHICKVLKLQTGDSIRVGIVNGRLGTAIIKRENDTVLLQDIEWQRESPPTLALQLIVGMPRPQQLKRICQHCATLGFEAIHFLQTNRVEKSYWQSPSASDSAIETQLLLGLEQAGATQLPKIFRHRRFRPFVEDVLPELIRGRQAFIADASGEAIENCLPPSTPTVLAVGPEGGFLEKEIAAFTQRGCQKVGLGNRIYKVETAIPLLAAKLFHLP